MIITTQLGGDAKHITIAKVAHGLMMMTFSTPNVPDEECFETIKAGIDACPSGSLMMINSGEFYGEGLSTGNLELLARFFTKYPDYASKTFLSVKGGLKERSFDVDSSPNNLTRSVNNILKALDGKKKLDLFECARVDTKIPIEDTTKLLAEFIKDGKFNYLGMSECSAETLHRANKVHPIAIVEIEVSPWSYEEETKKVIAAAAELGVTVAAYSPIGRGFLSGELKKPEDLAESDPRRRYVRFQGENFQHNLQLVDALSVLAAKRNITPAELSIAWVSSLGKHIVPLPGSSKKERHLKNLNASGIELTKEEQAEIEKILGAFEVRGDRYFGLGDKAAHLWG